MGLRVSFELDDDDLKHFRLIMREARRAVARKSPEEIVDSAQTLLRDIEGTTTPGFILERIRKLQLMIRMLTDLDWRLPHQEATRVLSALAYFTEPEDLIPDQIPGVGFLDDAIMVELVVRELEHEIDAYEDFCEFRDRREAARGRKSPGNRDQWLAARRDELQARMRRRRDRGRRARADREILKLFD
jgi:uncharacterized membrane protein YkvA (DUF1232 family)